MTYSNESCRKKNQRNERNSLDGTCFTDRLQSQIRHVCGVGGGVVGGAKGDGVADLYLFSTILSNPSQVQFFSPPL